jgi:DNA-binding NarL/FixJ family response regulator
MPQPPLLTVVLSKRSLVRELLADLLRARCGARVLASCEAIEDCEAVLTGANLLVCDIASLPADKLQNFLARLHSRMPAIRVVTIDDSLGNFDIDDIISAVRVGSTVDQAPHEQLTPLEAEVLLAVASGQRNAEIARHMRRSSKTVEKHRANLLRKLGFRNVAQLTAYAIRHGLLNSDAILARHQG